tara:strand:+ start:2549 stop:3097 length:549 start_codon:yes stop_codon:yes gene_type:complete
MVETKPTTEQKWTKLMERVTKWLAMLFWSEKDADTATKDFLEDSVVRGNEGDDNAKKAEMMMISGIIKRYVGSENACPGGKGSPLAGNAWDVISLNPQLAITLLTTKKGEKRTLAESRKAAMSRLARVIKDNNFTTVGEITEFLTIGTGEVPTFFTEAVEMDEDGKVIAVAEEPTEGENLEG